MPNVVSPEQKRALFLLRFGELWLKSFEVKKRFTDRLITNISDALGASGIPLRIIRTHDRIFAETRAQYRNKAAEILPNIFGLVSFSSVAELRAETGEIERAVLEIAEKTLKKGDTFAVRAKRTGKHDFTSNELERKIGASVVEKFENKVNLTKPDKTLFIEVRDDKAYVFSEKISASGGLPIGVEGKVAVLFSKGCDYGRSIIAAKMMMKRGCKVVPLFVEPKNEENDDEKKEKEKENQEIIAINAVSELKKFDPLLKPAFIKSEKSAFSAAWKNHARALVLSDSLEGVFSKKQKQFDKKTGIFVLQPLVGIP